MQQYGLLLCSAHPLGILVTFIADKTEALGAASLIYHHPDAQSRACGGEGEKVTG